jgi:hypothetical protein
VLNYPSHLSNSTLNIQHFGSIPDPNLSEERLAAGSAKPAACLKKEGRKDEEVLLRHDRA